MEEKTGVQLCRECPADPLERNTQRHRILCCDIIMKTNCNRDQFKRIFSFFAAVLLVQLVLLVFARRKRPRRILVFAGTLAVVLGLCVWACFPAWTAGA